MATRNRFRGTERQNTAGTNAKSPELSPELRSLNVRGVA